MIPTSNTQMTFQEKEQKTVKIIEFIFIFSLISIASLAMNSFMQSIFDELPIKPKNKILANLIWVIFIILLTSISSIYIFKDQAINPSFYG